MMDISSFSVIIKCDKCHDTMTLDDLKWEEIKHLVKIFKEKADEGCQWQCMSCVLRDEAKNHEEDSNG